MEPEENRSGIVPLDAALPALRQLGPAGFIFAQDITFWGPRYYYSEYPKGWQTEYESRSYAHFDPILMWSVTSIGARRWSEIRLIDLRGVMKAARKHGLNYGACFAKLTGGQRSVLSVARSDRELTDVEMAFLTSMFDEMLHEIGDGVGTVALTGPEAATLRCLRDGLSHAEAAELLEISIPTVKARLKAIRGKLGARSATQAVARAIQLRLI